MIEVLRFADADVRRRVLDRVGSARRPLLVCALRADRHSRPAAQREPFASLEAELEDRLDQLLVVDDGAVEGMWRDPVGDLADHLFGDDREAAFAAASGYLLCLPGGVRTVRRTGSSDQDRRAIHEALAREVPGIDPPPRRGAQRRPRPARAGGAPGWNAAPDPDVHAAEPTAQTPLPEDEDPGEASVGPTLDEACALLGARPDASLEACKAAFRALIVQYHPDKVAHLAPEFRELAERRTRELIEAWAIIEAAKSTGE